MRLRRRRRRDTFLPWLKLMVDCISIELLLRTAFWFRFSSHLFQNGLGAPDAPVYYRLFTFTLLMLVFFMRLYGLYRTDKVLDFADETARVFKAVTAGTLVLMAATFFYREFSFSRTYFVIGGVVLALGVSVERHLLGVAVMAFDQRRGSLRNVLIVGLDENSKKLARFYKENPRLSVRVMGFLDDKAAKGAVEENVSVLGSLRDLEEIIKLNRDLHEVVLAAQGLPQETVLKIIYQCEKEMVAFRWVSDIFGLIAVKMNVSYLAGLPLLSFSDSPLADWENRFLKRAMDIAVSLLALLLFSPFFLIIAVWVKLGSEGPVFYKQQRIGEDGRRFELLKFRTMRKDAEAQTGPVWAKANDPRRTTSGAFLRANNLDESPQLWNVLKGDMSLVGPRPERPFFVSQFKEDIPRYMARHSIRSGITGWAQVNGLRGNTSIEERTKFDLYYIENWSLLFDVKILVFTLFARRNAY